MDANTAAVVGSLAALATAAGGILLTARSVGTQVTKDIKEHVDQKATGLSCRIDTLDEKIDLQHGEVTARISDMNHDLIVLSERQARHDEKTVGHGEDIQRIEVSLAAANVNIGLAAVGIATIEGRQQVVLQYIKNLEGA